MILRRPMVCCQRLVVVAVAAAVFLLTIPEAQSQTTNLTISDLVTQTASLSSLESALRMTGLDRVLSQAGNFTVLAPNDMAFAELQDENSELASVLSSSAWVLHLTELLLAHVVDGTVLLAADITTGLEIATSSAANDTFQATVAPDNTTSFSPAVVTSAATVVTPDVMASNGVAHVVNDFLQASFLTMSVYDFVANNASTFANLANLAGLDDFYDDEFGLTLFLPTEEAFDDLDRDVVDYLTSARGRYTLRSLLLYHTLQEVLPSHKVSAGQSTIQAADRNYLTLFNQPGELEVNDATVEQEDILVNNGIIHMVDEVLIPPTLSMADLTGTNTPVAPAHLRVASKGKGKGKGKGGSLVIRNSGRSRFFRGAGSKGKGGFPVPASKGKGYVVPPPVPSKGKGGGGYFISGGSSKGKGYYTAPAKGKGYYPTPAAKGKGYGGGLLVPSAKGKGYYTSGSKGKGYYTSPSKGKGYYPPPAKGKGYYTPPAAKGKGYYSANPAKGGGGYLVPAAKGGYYSPPSKGTYPVNPAKGGGGYLVPAKGSYYSSSKGKGGYYSSSSSSSRRSKGRSRGFW